MCGIVGVVNLDDRPVIAELLMRMNQQIGHRGRDDEGYIFIQQSTNNFNLFGGDDSPPEIQSIYPHISDGLARGESNIGLGHRRYSIIDLSIGGHQPFFDKNNEYCVIFNGEIYNFIELRIELENLGHTFRTSSDTETIVEAYKEWGTECFKHLNGMWALALYDFRHKILIVSRDRAGKKPLYWAKHDNVVYFASEIKALLEVSEISKSKTVNQNAIYPFLAYGQRDLNNTTFFGNIHSLPAASWAIINRDFPHNINQYWHLPKKRLKESEISINEASKAVRETLSNAVDIRLRADVPWAIELSGGMDSSAIVALASQSYQKQLTTYTVRFSERNEEPFARSVAKHFNTDYNVIDSPLDNFWHEIRPFTYLEEEPYHAPNVHTNQIIRRMMRAEGIKMLLNGAAGDELFAGYRFYYTNFQFDNLRSGRFKSYIHNSLDWSEGGMLRALAYPFGNRILERIKSHRSGIRNGLQNLSVSNKPSYSYQTLSQRLFNDFVNTKIPYWVRVGDKTHMGIPIEARNPFLDYRMVELVSTLPMSYLIRDGWHKWILRKALEEILPSDVVWRKVKMGFPFPYKSFYFKSNLIIKTIFEMSDNPFVNQKHQSQFEQNWLMISFVLWYEMFFNENTKLFQQLESIGKDNNQQIDYGYTPQFLSTANF